MPEIIGIVLVISLIVLISPLSWQSRKLWRMADEDLKKNDYDEWKKQLKSNAYIRLFTRLIWGIVLLSGYILNFQKVVAFGFNWLIVFVSVLGISFIIWGILGFRAEIRKLS